MNIQEASQFIGKPIAVKSLVHPNKYTIFHKLTAIYHAGVVNVEDKRGNTFIFPLSRLVDPAQIEEDAEVVRK